LRVAAAYEARTPWHQAVPTLLRARATEPPPDATEEDSE
jgi:hypothetical protein